MQPLKSVICSLLLLVSYSSAFGAGKPNIVYILADNWGWDDISRQGGTVPTSRI